MTTDEPTTYQPDPDRPPQSSGMLDVQVVEKVSSIASNMQAIVLRTLDTTLQEHRGDMMQAMARFADGVDARLDRSDRMAAERDRMAVERDLLRDRQIGALTLLVEQTVTQFGDIVGRVTSLEGAVSASNIEARFQTERAAILSQFADREQAWIARDEAKELARAAADAKKQQQRERWGMLTILVILLLILGIAYSYGVR